MTSRIRNKLWLLALVILTMGVTATHVAYAQTGSTPAGTVAQAIGTVATFNGLNLWQLVSEGLANAFYSLQTVASWILALAGTLLNYSVVLTLNIHNFVQATPAIYLTWKAIRDISSLFIIFFLLYAALKLIFGLDAKFASLLKNIVVAGVLINFSFFFAGLGIDASNVISFQLYNAIAPANSLNRSLSPSGVSNTLQDGGLADIFMSALKVPALYSPNGQATAATAAVSGGAPAWTDPFKIILMEVTSIVIMLTAALSFTLAAAAFVVRFIILLFLLAFSPVWFAAHIVPEIGEYAKTWVSHYKSMLMFMPVYLLLMYLALYVLTSVGPLGTGNVIAVAVSAGTASSTAAVAGATTVAAAGTTAVAAAGSATTWYGSFLALGVNAVIVIFLLNLPLVAAVSIGGSATSWIDTKKYGAAGVWKTIGGYTGTRTVGAAASKADKWLGNTRLGNSVLGRDLRGATTGALAKSKMGGGRSAEDRAKLNKEVSTKAKEMDRRQEYEREFKRGGSLKSVLGKMSEKERLGLGGKNLKDPNVLRHLKRSDFEAIKKSDDFSESDKREIADARKKAFSDAVTANQADVVKDMMKNMDIDDITSNPALITNDTVIANITPGQLKKISDDGLLDAAGKKSLGQKIDVWASNTSANPTGATHQAYSFVNKPGNVAEWLSTP